MEGETEIYFLGNCKDRAWKIKHEVPIDIYILLLHTTCCIAGTVD